MEIQLYLALGALVGLIFGIVIGQFVRVGLRGKGTK
jgi:hypothetical protein